MRRHSPAIENAKRLPWGLAWFVAFGLLLLGLGGPFLRTPEGRHCPTAPVQRIEVASVDCCGKTTLTTRELRLGDKGFVQCRCAEQRRADKHIVVKLEPAPIPSIEIPVVASPRTAAPAYEWNAPSAWWSTPPPCPPPPFA